MKSRLGHIFHHPPPFLVGDGGNHGIIFFSYRFFGRRNLDNVWLIPRTSNNCQIMTGGAAQKRRGRRRSLSLLLLSSRAFTFLYCENARRRRKLSLLLIPVSQGRAADTHLRGDDGKFPRHTTLHVVVAAVWLEGTMRKKFFHNAAAVAAVLSLLPLLPLAAYVISFGAGENISAPDRYGESWLPRPTRGRRWQRCQNTMEKRPGRRGKSSPATFNQGDWSWGSSAAIRGVVVLAFTSGGSVVREFQRHCNCLNKQGGAEGGNC